MTYEQPAPFCVQVEPTEGCNLRCGFCGIQGIREVGPVGDRSGPYRFMTPAIAETIAREIRRLGWSSRIEFAMHGEPLRNPDVASIISTFRHHLPNQSLMLTTNGLVLAENGADPVRGVIRLLEAGLNAVVLDDYRPHRVAPTLREGADRFARAGVAVTEYPAQPDPSPNGRHPGARRLIIVEDISDATTGTHSHLANHAGAAGPADTSWNSKRCAKPFRELAVRWDGNVAICCDDWRGEYKIGNVTSTPLDAIWQHPRMMAARRRLMESRAGLGPCDGCTARSYRVGLLPSGQRPKEAAAALGRPTPADDMLVAQALAGPSFTAPVARKWEPVTLRTPDA